MLRSPAGAAPPPPGSPCNPNGEPTRRTCASSIPERSQLSRRRSHLLSKSFIKRPITLVQGTWVINMYFVRLNSLYHLGYCTGASPSILHTTFRYCRCLYRLSRGWPEIYGSCQHHRRPILRFVGTEWEHKAKKVQRHVTPTIFCTRNLRHCRDRA